MIIYVKETCILSPLKLQAFIEKNIGKYDRLLYKDIDLSG